MGWITWLWSLNLLSVYFTALQNHLSYVKEYVHPWWSGNFTLWLVSQPRTVETCRLCWMIKILQNWVLSWQQAAEKFPLWWLVLLLEIRSLLCQNVYQLGDAAPWWLSTVFAWVRREENMKEDQTNTLACVACRGKKQNKVMFLYNTVEHLKLFLCVFSQLFGRISMTSSSQNIHTSWTESTSWAGQYSIKTMMDTLMN